jgi:predicted lipoprotein with Yx(FWY)xxD motif
MRRPRKVILALGLGVAAAGVGVAVAQSTHSASTAATSATTTAAPSQNRLTPTTAVPGPAGPATINVVNAIVTGKSEKIFVDARGLPLYTYRPDTATQSNVSGALARAWPPLVSSSPTETDATGTLSVVTDPNGQLVQYNGHFLYTFVNDTPGHVTGQGVAGFFVATPNLVPIPGADASQPAPPAATQSNPYGY